MNDDLVRYVAVDASLKARFAQEWGDRVARHLHLSDGFSLAAVSGHTLKGVISVYWKLLPSPLSTIVEGYIDIIEVHPDARKKGIATHLIEQSVERTKAHAAYQLRAWTSEEKTEALQMWVALGFGLTPATTYPGGKEVRGYFATKPLS